MDAGGQMTSYSSSVYSLGLKFYIASFNENLMALEIL